jgi:hypothetical protein
MRCIGARVARAQLSHLLEAGDWPGMTIRVVPFTADAFIGSAQAMLYASGPIAQLDTVQLDSYNRGVFLDAAAQLDKVP